MSEGWILGFQTPIDNGMYASEEAFESRVRAWVEESRRACPEAWAAGEGRILLFPEVVAAWLVFSGGPPEAVRPEVDLEGAMALLAIRSLEDPDLARQHPALVGMLGDLLLEAGGGAATADWPVRFARVLTALHGPRAALRAHRVFSGLARDTGSWVVGSTVYAPAFRAEGGSGLGFEAPEDLLLYAQAPVYDPEGRLASVSRKAYPVDRESFLRPAPPTEVEAVETGFGRAAVLVCADSWYRSAYRSLARQQAEILLVPCYGFERGRWTRKWEGFQGLAAAEDQEALRAALQDPDFTEEDGWRTFALRGRLELVTAARVGMNAFAVGRAWGVDVGGESSVVWKEDGAVREAGAGTFRDGRLLAVRAGREIRVSRHPLGP